MRTMIVLAASLAASTSLAQSMGGFGETPNPWSIRLGLSSLTDGKTKDMINRSGVRFGISYDLGSKGLFSASTIGVDYDYQQVNGNGNRFETHSAILVERVTLGHRGDGFAEAVSFPYFGYGLGIAYNLERNSLVQRFDNYPFAAQALVGYRINRNLFVEAAFRTTGKLKEARGDGFSLMVGYRF
jgi:hypothetical protein